MSMSLLRRQSYYGNTIVIAKMPIPLLRIPKSLHLVLNQMTMAIFASGLGFNAAHHRKKGRRNEEQECTERGRSLKYSIVSKAASIRIGNDITRQVANVWSLKTQ